MRYRVPEVLLRWRRGWDSNPRYGFPYARFRGEYFQPLSHLSAVVVTTIVADRLWPQQRPESPLLLHSDCRQNALDDKSEMPAVYGVQRPCAAFDHNRATDFMVRCGSAPVGEKCLDQDGAFS